MLDVICATHFTVFDIVVIQSFTLLEFFIVYLLYRFLK